jgi:nicotinamide/nicotinate riboside kinase
LPAVYSAVKVRREGRDGYVTIGEQPAPGPGNLSSTESESGSLPVEKTGEGGDSLDGPAELNFWVDPPGYVDDVVWPRYLKYHDWLLVPVDQDAAERGDLVEAFGEGGKCYTDVGVSVAPGEGAVGMDVVLRWAVEEVLRGLAGHC